jgi:hypothetical protein
MAVKKPSTVITPTHNEFSRYPYLDTEGRLTEKALYQLTKPFDPADLKWLPTDVKKDAQNNETALALVYTDPRAYHERLDLVFGPGNWGSSLTFTTAQFFKALPQKMGWGKDKDKVISEARDVVGYKLFAVCNLEIAGLGVKTSAGEEDTSDGNAATSAEAQSFKRACSMIGIGRYFYFFPRERMPFSYGKFTEFPKLPEWAIPKPECSVTGLPIEGFTFTNKKGDEETWTAEKVAATSLKLFGAYLSGPLMMERVKLRSAPAAEVVPVVEDKQEEAA